MKIPPSSSGTPVGGATQSGEAGRSKSAPGKTAATSAGSDAVKLSSLSTTLHAVTSSVSAPEFDRAKVDQIKQAIRDGKLVIKTDVVADRMIEDVKARIAKGGK
jgi:flagellar biosynthesis anti-sigma factor FlgM